MIKKILIIVTSAALLLASMFVGVHFYSKYLVGYTKTYIAAHQISQRTRIGKEDLIEIEVPKDYLKNDVYVEIEDIDGKYVKLGHSIPKGSLIYKTALESDIKDLANTLLLEGEVNYDLYTSDIKINTANLGKNMYVDLYLTINSKDKPISDLLLSNARITGLYDANNKLIQDYDTNSKVYIISLAINGDDVKVLNKAQVVGNLNCVVSKNTYNSNLKTILNKNSLLFEYLE